MTETPTGSNDPVTEAGTNAEQEFKWGDGASFDPQDGSADQGLPPDVSASTTGHERVDVIEQIGPADGPTSSGDILTDLLGQPDTHSLATDMLGAESGSDPLDIYMDGSGSVLGFPDENSIADAAHAAGAAVGGFLGQDSTDDSPGTESVRDDGSGWFSGATGTGGPDDPNASLFSDGGQAGDSLLNDVITPGDAIVNPDASLFGDAPSGGAGTESTWGAGSSQEGLAPPGFTDGGVFEEAPSGEAGAALIDGPFPPGQAFDDPFGARSASQGSWNPDAYPDGLTSSPAPVESGSVESGAVSGEGSSGSSSGDFPAGGAFDVGSGSASEGSWNPDAYPDGLTSSPAPVESGGMSTQGPWVEDPSNPGYNTPDAFSGAPVEGGSTVQQGPWVEDPSNPGYNTPDAFSGATTDTESAIPYGGWEDVPSDNTPDPFEATSVDPGSDALETVPSSESPDVFDTTSSNFGTDTYTDGSSGSGSDSYVESSSESGAGTYDGTSTVDQYSEAAAGGAYAGVSSDSGSDAYAGASDSYADVSSGSGSDAYVESSSETGSGTYEETSASDAYSAGGETPAESGYSDAPPPSGTVYIDNQGQAFTVDPSSGMTTEVDASEVGNYSSVQSADSLNPDQVNTAGSDVDLGSDDATATSGYSSYSGDSSSTSSGDAAPAYESTSSDYSSSSDAAPAYESTSSDYSSGSSDYSSSSYSSGSSDYSSGSSDYSSGSSDYSSSDYSSGSSDYSSSSSYESSSDY